MELNSGFINIDTIDPSKIENESKKNKDYETNSKKNKDYETNSKKKKNEISKNLAWKRFNISQKNLKKYIKWNSNLKYMLGASLFINFYNYFSSYTVKTLI